MNQLNLQTVLPIVLVVVYLYFLISYVKQINETCQLTPANKRFGEFYYKLIFVMILAPFLTRYLMQGRQISIKTMLMIETGLSALMVVLNIYLWKFINEAQKKCELNTRLHNFGKVFRILVGINFLGSLYSLYTNGMRLYNIRDMERAVSDYGFGGGWCFTKKCREKREEKIENEKTQIWKDYHRCLLGGDDCNCINKIKEPSPLVMKSLENTNPSWWKTIKERKKPCENVESEYGRGTYISVFGGPKEEKIMRARAKQLEQQRKQALKEYKKEVKEQKKQQIANEKMSKKMFQIT